MQGSRLVNQRSAIGEKNPTADPNFKAEDLTDDMDLFAMLEAANLG